MAMLDFDMMASPNFARFVYDGDGSDFPGNEGPTGSDIIESLFTGYWAGRGLASETIPFDGRSDYVAFTDAGSPPAASSPAPRASRPRSRRPSTAAPPAWRSTSATTRRATPWPT